MSNYALECKAAFHQPGKRKDQKCWIRSACIPKQGHAEGTLTWKRMEARMAHNHNRLSKILAFFNPRGSETLQDYNLNNIPIILYIYTLL